MVTPEPEARQVGQFLPELAGRNTRILYFEHPFRRWRQGTH